jgi:hypothetical protein
MNKILLAVVLVLFLSFSIGLVHADNGININQLPTQIENKLGVDLFTAQLIASTALIVMISILLGFALRGKGSQLPIIALCDFLGLGICVALTWLPIWTFTVCIFMVAILAGLRLKDLI